MNSIGRREFILGAVSIFFTACHSEKKDTGVENIKYILSTTLNSELKSIDPLTKPAVVTVSRTGEHMYQANIEYNGMSVNTTIPPNSDIPQKIVPEILKKLKVNKSNPPQPKRKSFRWPNPNPVQT